MPAAAAFVCALEEIQPEDNRALSLRWR